LPNVGAGQNPLASVPRGCNTPRVANHGDAPIRTGSKVFSSPSLCLGIRQGCDTGKATLQT